MSDQAMDLVAKVKAFKTEVMAFVNGRSEEDWAKMCAPEEWSVGVTARHITWARVGRKGE